MGHERHELTIPSLKKNIYNKACASKRKKNKNSGVLAIKRKKKKKKRERESKRELWFVIAGGWFYLACYVLMLFSFCIPRKTMFSFVAQPRFVPNKRP